MPSKRPSMHEVLREVTQLEDEERRAADLATISFNQITRKLPSRHVTPSKIAKIFNCILDDELMLLDVENIVYIADRSIDVFDPEPLPGKNYVVQGKFRSLFCETFLSRIIK